jgi:methylmalonyl-CoA/ethylmalonyl-CoA epimerase
MDRPVTTDLHAMLAPEGAGGLIDSPDRPDPALLAATANEYGARFAELAGPTTKGELLDALATGLGLPTYLGRNWDALEEVLAHPEADAAGPAIVSWHDPARLPAADAATFRAIVTAAAEARAAAGDGALIVVAGPVGVPADGPASDPGHAAPHARAVRRPRAPRSPAAPVVPPAIRSLGKIHHVALIVASIETALGFWRDTVGAPLETIMDIEADRVRIAFLTVGESKIELVQPTDDTTGVARFLANKGEGFHHVCFEVPNLTEALTRLGLDGLELIDGAPRRGAEGPVAFVHPRSCHGVLVELIEAPGGPAWAALGFRA